MKSSREDTPSLLEILQRWYTACIEYYKVLKLVASPGNMFMHSRDSSPSRSIILLIIYNRLIVVPRRLRNKGVILLMRFILKSSVLNKNNQLRSHTMQIKLSLEA